MSPRQRSRRRSTILRPSWLTVERAASVTITELLGFILTVCGAGGALWFRIESAIRAAPADAMLVAATATAKADVLATALGEFRVHVAETYVSKQWLRQQGGQVMDLLRDVQNDVELRKRAARPRDRRPAGAAWRPNQDFLDRNCRVQMAGNHLANAVGCPRPCYPRPDRPAS